MPSKSLWIAAGCVMAVLGLLPAFSSAASAAATEKILYTFIGGNDGEYPSSDLTLDAQGNLYGTTVYGGSNGYCKFHGEEWPGCGTVFELVRSGDTWTEQVLYTFDGSGGAFPETGVIFDSAGNLYGTTYNDPDANDCGNVFKLAPNPQVGWTESVLYNFDCRNNTGSPTTDLIFDSQGNLFGATSRSVFELVPQPDSAWKEVTIHTNFLAISALALDASDDIYGMSTTGGNGRCSHTYNDPGCGMAFKLTETQPGKWSFSEFYDFARGGGTGIYPSGGLAIEDSSHVLGTTWRGGDGLGTIFELSLTKNGWMQNTLYRFYGDPNGAYPVGELMIRGRNLVGVTSQGGTTGNGAVFDFQYSKEHGWKESVLYSFVGGSDGSSPNAAVISDTQGNLYGTTRGGGSGNCFQGCGVVYEITP